MTKAFFHNALRLLISIDQHELIDAGVARMDERLIWQRFRDDPYRWFIQASDADADYVWAIIERRSGHARNGS